MLLLIIRDFFILKGLIKMTEEEFEEMERYEREKHDEKVRELEEMSSSGIPNK